jgi:ABC-type Fe3+-hydroxamate transport system substrate-binding protein
VRKIAILVVLAGLALAASACGERSEPTGPTVKLFPVTVNGTGGSPIALQHAPARVVACKSVASALVNTLEQGARSRPEIRDVACGGAGGVGQTLPGFRPDVVIASDLSRWYGKGPVYSIPEGSIRDAESGIVSVGALLGLPLQARAMVQHIEAKRLEVRRKVENLPRISVFLDTGFYITVSSNSFAGQLISEAGGQNVAGASPGVTPDLGLLHRKNPDYYLATSDSGISLKDLRKNPRTRTLRAVRAGHFAIVPSSYLDPGPNIGNAIETIARLLHPNAFR